MSYYLIEQKITIPLLIMLLLWNLSEFKPKISKKKTHKIKIHIYRGILRNWAHISFG